MLDRLNEAARRGGVTETLHGIRIEDPYRSLEEDTPDTRAWIDAQTERTERALAGRLSGADVARLDALLSIGVIGGVDVAGRRVFYTKREGDREQPALYVTESGAPRSEPLVDPLTFGERAALDWYFPSPSGRLVAFGISQNGDERSTLHVLDVESGQLRPERIERTKWSTVEWLNDETGFYYTRYPKPGEPGFDAEHEDGYFPRIFFHRLGDDPASDPLVYGSERNTDFPSASVSDDDRWVVINVFRGWSASDVFLLDRGANRRARVIAPSDDRPLLTVVDGRDAITVGRVHGGKLWLFTNEGAPKYRIARVDPARAADMASWRDVVPEAEAAIQDWTIAGDRLAVHYIEDVRSRVKLFRADGRFERDVELPGSGSVEGLAGAPDSTTLAFAFSSYVHAPSLLACDVRRGGATQIDQVRNDVALDRIHVEQARVRSADGTMVPVTLVMPADLPRDGSARVLINGYGGFNVSLLPAFTRHAIYWVESGGVFAVANLRGGGELGEDWHRAGNLQNKTKVFEDFEAVIRWVSSSGLSRPERIAITGGSNGGLLMGAMITRAPDAFGAVMTYVGLYDMVRFHRFPPAELWISEYGDPDEPEALRNLHGYSPYHQVRPGTCYPATLVETADHDSRVHWSHSTKFTARLQEAQSCDEPIYFYMERQIGHGAGTRKSDLVRRYVRLYAFLSEQLGSAR